MGEMVSISKRKYVMLTRENKALRNTKLYRRLLEFEENIRKGTSYSRTDLGF